jgi:transcriptional regulator with XRE-family HTH domain
MSEELDDASFLRGARQQLKLTQAQLAEVICVPNATIRRLEAGGSLTPLARAAVRHMVEFLCRYVVIIGRR